MRFWRGILIKKLKVNHEKVFQKEIDTGRVMLYHVIKL